MVYIINKQNKYEFVGHYNTRKYRKCVIIVIIICLEFKIYKYILK